MEADRHVDEAEESRGGVVPFKPDSPEQRTVGRLGMSLIAEAKALAEERKKSKPCVMAKAITDAEIDPADARELIRDPSIDSVVKYDVLAKHGMVAAKSTVQNKIVKGCNCIWCAENGNPEAKK